MTGNFMNENYLLNNICSYVWRLLHLFIVWVFLGQKLILELFSSLRLFHFISSYLFVYRNAFHHWFQYMNTFFTSNLGLFGDSLVHHFLLLMFRVQKSFVLSWSHHIYLLNRICGIVLDQPISCYFLFLLASTTL